jgi:hypothetical protein
MDKIDIQKKAKPQTGRIEKYLFENETIGLKKTLFHRIYIPLLPFDSGLDYVEQPEETEIVFEWFSLNLKDPDNLNGLDLNHKNYPDAEASIYVGSAHNWCNINHLIISKIKEEIYQLKIDIEIDFEAEGVALNESFVFQTEVLLKKEIHDET